MNLRKANLCLNCEEMFQGVVCPRCAACTWRPLSAWVCPVVPEDRPLLVGSALPRGYYPKLDGEAA
jgi:hypothetical protein